MYINLPVHDDANNTAGFYQTAMLNDVAQLSHVSIHRRSKWSRRSKRLVVVGTASRCRRPSTGLGFMGRKPRKVGGSVHDFQCIVLHGHGNNGGEGTGYRLSAFGRKCVRRRVLSGCDFSRQKYSFIIVEGVKVIGENDKTNIIKILNENR